MDVVQLNDGSVEIIGSHRDLVDVIRDKCGDDIAKKVEENDPGDWEAVYDAYDKLYEATEFMEDDIESDPLSLEQLKQIKERLFKAVELLGSVL